MAESTTLQKALYTIKKLRQMLEERPSFTPQPIAITGLSCRFPQAPGKEAYWQMLCKGQNIISSMPEERWELLKGSVAALRDPTHPYWGGFLQNVAAFDAYFFGISPREAARIDPQQRLLLEVAYEAFEDAGLSVEKLAGSATGVFASLDISQLAHIQKMDSEMDALYLPTGNAISIGANRISYLFDLHGPSIVVDSACSSSLASLHLACLNLQNKSCELAIVCGAKLNLLPYVNSVLAKAKMLSVDGQCKTFDAGANGYVQGEGVGAVILKPLDTALRDNDRIYAVITGSAINQDGKTNGLTAPNGLQQEKLLNDAYRSSHTNTQEISYVECHGTGTFLGDPIEIQALGEVVGKNREKEKPCWIGSVKTNIGHLEPAAGVASVIKVALALFHGKIPPHLNFSTPNPHIAFDKYHFKVPRQMEEMPKYGLSRIAGVSGFGFGGTNSHIVMRELADNEHYAITPAAHERAELFTLSAKDPAALSLFIDKWRAFLEKNPHMDLSQICYNLHLRRSHYLCRLAVIAYSTKELHEILCRLNEKLPVEPSLSPPIYMNSKKVMPQLLQSDVNENTDLSVLAASYVSGANIEWMKYEADRKYPYIDMPLYPWQHKDYWPPMMNHTESGQANSDSHPMQGKSVPSPLDTLQFEFIVDKLHMLDIQDTYNVVHAGYYMEIFAFVAKHLKQKTCFTITDHAFLTPLFMLNDSIIRVQIILNKIDQDSFNYHIYSNTEGQKNWVLHAKGILTLHSGIETKIDTIENIKKRSSINEPAEKLYERVLAMGMPAGESIRWTHQYWLTDREILCEFKQPLSCAEKNDLFTMRVHPGIIDASIQPVFRLLPPERVKPYIASGVKKATFHGIKKGPYYLLGKLDTIHHAGENLTGSCYLINQENELIAEFEDIALTQLDNKFQIGNIVNASDQFVKMDSKQGILDFLVEQMAIIFSMPREDIDINVSLRDMGIDSLMAIVLTRTLEKGLGVNYSVQTILEGPTIHEIAELALNNTVKKESKNIKRNFNPWIAYRQPQIHAKARLFCFPYGGGGASIYRDWQQDMSESIEICPIQLPGREGRLDEKAIGNITTLVDVLIENLQSEFDLPFAFFGHSLGSLIAFELTRALRKRHLPQPIHLFASAFPDPRAPFKSLDIMLKQLQDINVNLFDSEHSSLIASLSDETLSKLSRIFHANGIEEYGDHLQNREITKILLPIFSGDMGIVKNYQYQEDKSLNLPITVFAGKRDTWVSYEDQLRWGDHTETHCDIHSFDSGHLFIKDDNIRLEVIQKIKNALNHGV